MIIMRLLLLMLFCPKIISPSCPFSFYHHRNCELGTLACCSCADIKPATKSSTTFTQRLRTLLEPTPLQVKIKEEKTKNGPLNSSLWTLVKCAKCISFCREKSFASARLIPLGCSRSLMAFSKSLTIYNLAVSQ